MICERVVIIHEGEIVAVDRPENLASSLRGVERIELEVRGPQRDVAKALRDVEGVRDVVRTPGDTTGVSRFNVEVNLGFEVRAQLAVEVVNAGWDLLRLESIGMSLEEIFLRLTTSEDRPSE